MVSRPVRQWRQLVVWLHVVTSVGWMALALVLFVLLVTSRTTQSPAVAVSATSMAQLLDGRLLAPLANASAFTGFMLAAATPWGFFRHWWVLVKFVITLAQLYLGIFILSGVLADTASAARSAAAEGAAVAVAVRGRPCPWRPVRDGRRDRLPGLGVDRQLGRSPGRGPMKGFTPPPRLSLSTEPLPITRTSRLPKVSA